MKALTSALPANTCKKALCRGRPQIGLWVTSADAVVIEITGYDWLLFDAEHGPNDLRSVLTQTKAVSSSRAEMPADSPIQQPIVRLPSADPVLVKQVMELGIHTLMVPMIESAVQATSLAKAMRYPPEGIRGMGSGLARSSRWMRFSKYVNAANEQACLLVQVETAEGMRHIEAVTATPGVDSVFIGPANLSTSMGFRVQRNHPEVAEAIKRGVTCIRKAGNAAGILVAQESQAQKWLAAGVCFVAVGVDMTLLSLAAQASRMRFPANDAHQLHVRH